MAAAEHVGLAINNLKLRETLHRQSLCDALTGLYNRRYLEEALAKEVMRSVRSERPLAVLMIDIDHFKQVNDTWGHPLGDRLLADFGAFLLDHVRAEDIACRYGGEEFTLILRDTPREAALARAESIRAQVEQDLLADTREGPDRLTISIGLAIHPADARDPASLVAEADRALYAAKAAGRNRVMSAS